MAPDRSEDVRELEVVVVSDVVCPWCLIGVTRLDQALEAMPEVKAHVRFHPFLLDPTTPDEGEDLRQRLERKYRLPAAQMFARVEAAARESGIPLDFEKVRRSVPTIRAHTLIRLGEATGKDGALKRALLRAYFLEGKDVSSLETLVGIGVAQGLEDAAIRAFLSDERELATTRALAREASEQGVTGVPFFVFDEKLAVNGAQSVEVLKKVIARALEATPA
ncbi:MAG: DsbA family oxidoreductase [Sandaracinaceae bacterium]|nr:DsbA family oxidoreductase [Sandaracinaceae bacterium]